MVEVLTPFPLVVAEVPADTVDALQQDTATGSVTPDTTLHVQSLAGAPAEAAAVAAAGRPARNADAGKGVGVVVVDTGIADHPDLGDRVIARYAPDGNDPDDLHGHGTFMAGLVAGDGEEVDGIAPAANLVSVKVADDEGTTSLSTLLEGLVIADMARDELDAPVVLLAMSGERRDVPDPVMVVLEMLWARGSTVVVASGNRGRAVLARLGPLRDHGRRARHGGASGHGRRLGPRLVGARGRRRVRRRVGQARRGGSRRLGRQPAGRRLHDRRGVPGRRGGGRLLPRHRDLDGRSDHGRSRGRDPRR